MISDKAALGIIMNGDGSVRGVTVLGKDPEERKQAHRVMATLVNEINAFEKVMMSKLQRESTPIGDPK